MERSKAALQSDAESKFGLVSRVYPKPSRVCRILVGSFGFVTGVGLVKVKLLKLCRTTRSYPSELLCALVV